jgi:stringent starvation protein B
MGNEDITFQARFGGRAFPVVVPIERIAAIYARENGEGMAFDVTERSGVDAVASDGKIQDKLPQDYAADGDSVVGSLVERETASGVPSSTPISDRASGRPILTRVK